MCKMSYYILETSSHTREFETLDKLLSFIADDLNSRSTFDLRDFYQEKMVLRIIYQEEICIHSIDLHEYINIVFPASKYTPTITINCGKDGAKGINLFDLTHSLRKSYQRQNYRYVKYEVDTGSLLKSIKE